MIGHCKVISEHYVVSFPPYCPKKLWSYLSYTRVDCFCLRLFLFWRYCCIRQCRQSIRPLLSPPLNRPGQDRRSQRIRCESGVGERTPGAQSDCKWVDRNGWMLFCFGHCGCASSSLDFSRVLHISMLKHMNWYLKNMGWMPLANFTDKSCLTWEAMSCQTYFARVLFNEAPFPGL